VQPVEILEDAVLVLQHQVSFGVDFVRRVLVRPDGVSSW
jgi:hypothetical protein